MDCTQLINSNIDRIYYRVRITVMLQELFSKKQLITEYTDSSDGDVQCWWLLLGLSLWHFTIIRNRSTLIAISQTLRIKLFYSSEYQQKFLSSKLYILINKLSIRILLKSKLNYLKFHYLVFSKSVVKLLCLITNAK